MESGQEDVDMGDEGNIDNILDTGSVTVLVIGDPHFKARNIKEGIDFIERLVEVARREKPTFIVCLGDILDTHEVVRVSAHKLAHDFIEKLSSISPLYLLMGNHDLINASQFCTDNHIFNPYKRWKNVTIVDKPIVVEQGESTFVMCPYVPPGRFVEALDSLAETTDFVWDMATCIFAHQEFRGCKMGSIESEIGDEWNKDYPPVISGHIHEAQTVGENVYYPGSSIQHAYGEPPDKSVWIVNFDPECTEEPLDIDRIDLGMKKKKILKLDVAEISTREDIPEMAAETSLKIDLTGTSEEFKIFRRSAVYNKLARLGVKFKYTPRDADKSRALTGKDTNYETILHNLVAARESEVMSSVFESIKSRVRNGPDLVEVHTSEKVVYSLEFED